MLNPQSNQALINSFLQEQLSDSEMHDFRQRLKTDPIFVRRFEEQRLLAHGIKLARMRKQAHRFQNLERPVKVAEIELDQTTISRAIRLEKDLKILDRYRKKNEEIEVGKVVKISKRKNWQPIAAGILFILGLSWYFLLFESKNDYQLLAEKI